MRFDATLFSEAWPIADFAGKSWTRSPSPIESCAVPHPLRVAVDGRTASGKTTLADEVATVLRLHGRQVIRTSVDGFHRPRAERYRRGPHSPEGYLDDARDWRALRHLLLDPLGTSGDRWYRTATFDLERDQPIAQAAVRAEPSAVLIVDGTFLQRDELADAWDAAQNGPWGCATTACPYSEDPAGVVFQGTLHW